VPASIGWKNAVVSRWSVRRAAVRRAVVVAVLVPLAGCASMGGPLPPLQFPQVKQARQSVEGGLGRRYEDYDACRKKTTSVAAIVDCMRVTGYDYIARSTEQQAAECWRLRDPQLNKDGRLPEAWCFFRRAEAPAR
jgi:hypothetical protein